MAPGGQRSRRPSTRGAMSSKPKRGSRASQGAYPPPEQFPVSSRALKVKILSGSLSDTVKGPCTGTVGVWSEARDGWVVPPMTITMVVDGSTFYYPDILSFILGEDSDPTREEFDLRIELTEKKMLRTHKVAQISMPFSGFARHAGDQEFITDGAGPQSLGLSGRQPSGVLDHVISWSKLHPLPQVQQASNSWRVQRRAEICVALHAWSASGKFNIPHAGSGTGGSMLAPTLFTNSLSKSATG